VRYVVDLGSFASAVMKRTSEWSARGASWELRRSPDDGRDKAAVWVTVKAHDGSAAQLTVWDSGEAELEVMAANGALTQSHFEGLLDAHRPLGELANSLDLGDIVVHLVHAEPVQSGGLEVRKRRGPFAVAIAAVIAALLSLGYSTGLGFGVNERCDRLDPGTDCSRLNWMALLHAGAQVVLVIAAGVGGVSVWRASSGWRRSSLMAAVAVVYVCLVVTAVVVYTDAAWNWANSRG
jgi:hypothetical protein